MGAMGPKVKSWKTRTLIYVLACELKSAEKIITVVEKDSQNGGST